MADNDNAPPLSSPLTLTHIATITAIRFLLFTLHQAEAVSSDDARQFATVMAGFVRGLDVIPELVAVSESVAQIFDTMVADYQVKAAEKFDG